MRNTIPIDDAKLNLIWQGLSYQNYAEFDAINAHGLNDLLVSPAYYRFRLKQDKEMSSSMKMGILTDLAIFEPHVFRKSYAIKGTPNPPEGAETISVPVGQRVAGMVEGVWKNPFARELLQEGIAQPVVLWRDRVHGVHCKARLDFISTIQGRKVAVDLKTTTDSNPYKFQKKIVDFRYDLQAAHYLEAARASGAFSVDTFMFIVVQSCPPHSCFVFKAGDSVLTYGTIWRDHAMQIFAECSRRNAWPGKPDFQTIEMPYWAKTPEEEESTSNPLEAQPLPPDDEIEGF